MVIHPNLPRRYVCSTSCIRDVNKEGSHTVNLQYSRFMITNPMPTNLWSSDRVSDFTHEGKSKIITNTQKLGFQP